MTQPTSIAIDKQIQILQNQQFTDTQPGTLLKDFNTLLDFIGEKGVVVSEKTQFLAMGVLAELNQRLSNPLDVKLKRPMQKSYPHINGLYLLLRASGLSYFEGDGKKTTLLIDKSLLAEWKKLNPTEQYFFLLQTFYYRANTAIIGEELTRFSCTAFFECLEFWDRDLQEGVFEIKTPNNKEHIRYIPGLHNLALMELFGFVSIECDKNDETATWPVSKISLTELGETVVSYFIQNKWVIEGGLCPRLIPNKKATTYWDDELKKLISDWKNSFITENNKTIATQTEGCYIFNVKLEKASYKLAVPSNLSLTELASGILDAFDFNDHLHLYQFIYKNQYGVEKRIDSSSISLFPDEYQEDVDEDEEEYELEYSDLTSDECSVGQLPLYKGMMITFWFDFSDNWEFNIQVAQMSSPELKFDDLTVLEKKGTPPKQYWDDE